MSNIALIIIRGSRKETLLSQRKNSNIINEFCLSYVDVYFEVIIKSRIFHLQKLG
jgi:hypothetical protein